VLVGEDIGLREGTNHSFIAAPSEELIIELPCPLGAGSDEQQRELEVMIEASQKIGLSRIEHRYPFFALIAEQGFNKPVVGGQFVN
jgi:hypothetical protein